MSYPFIIWCRQRTGSTSLFSALCSVSEHPAAAVEPFDDNVPNRPLSIIGKRLPPAERDRALRSLADQSLLIKHCYENLSAEFNHALAEISTRAGYRHIHLYRRDEVARLISRGVAIQHGTWVVDNYTKAKYKTWQAGQAGQAKAGKDGKGLMLPPLDIQMLKENHELCESRWKAIRGLLQSPDIALEDLITYPRLTLSKLAIYLGYPSFQVDKMRANLGPNQSTPSIWNLIPNIEELRGAIK